MPLQKGCAPETISKNISEMVHAGHKHDRAVAAAMRSCDRSGHGIKQKKKKKQ